MIFATGRTSEGCTVDQHRHDDALELENAFVAPL